MKKIALILMLGTLAGCAGTPKEPIRDNLIVPRVRIGEAALGMTEANLLKWIGTPTKTYSYRGSDNQYLYAKGLWVGFSGGKASGIAVMAGPYRTADGIGIGTPELQMRGAWGTPTKQQELDGQRQYCFKNGLTATVDARARTVKEIAVYASGCGIA